MAPEQEPKPASAPAPAPSNTSVSRPRGSTFGIVAENIRRTSMMAFKAVGTRIRRLTMMAGKGLGFDYYAENDIKEEPNDKAIRFGVLLLFISLLKTRVFLPP